MATASYFGRGLWLGAGVESTYGTAVTRTVFRRLLSATITRTVKKVQRSQLHRSGASSVGTSYSHYRASDDVEGSVTFEADYSGMGLFLSHSLGSVSTTGPSVSYYTHTHILAAALPTGLTIEIGKPTGTSEVFEGCKITTFKLSVSAEGQTLITLDFIGETSAGPTTVGTPTFTTELPVDYHQAGTLSWNGATYYVKSLTVDLDNALVRRRFLGSLNTQEPQRDGLISLTWDIELEVDDAWTTAHTADTESDAVLRFTNTATIAYLELTLHNAFVEAEGHSADKPGILMDSVKLVGQGDGTDHGMSIVNKNLNSSAIAN